MLAILLALAAPAQAAPTAPVQTPSEIVAAAKPDEWAPIAPEDLLVMDLAAVNGTPRRVVIQLMPPPFSRGWIANIRLLARARWWDGTSVNRVQDDYVAQWGDPNGEDKATAKPLPPGLNKVSQREYEEDWQQLVRDRDNLPRYDPATGHSFDNGNCSMTDTKPPSGPCEQWERPADSYADGVIFYRGWPIASQSRPVDEGRKVWPVHCYAMVGVGRDMPPDTGTGAELYAVIGHAPRHLDRNIALVGRVVEGIDHLSSLPRGTGDLGFYKTAAERTPIRSVRLASELPAAEQPHLQYLSTESASFARYADARANRRDAFFIHPAGGADVCNIPVPIRRTP